MLPFQIAVQEACARIGAVTGKGLAAVVREHYGKLVLYALVSLVLIANTINIGADIGAMGAAAHLLLPLPFVVFPVISPYIFVWQAMQVESPEMPSAYSGSL